MDKKELNEQLTGVIDILKETEESIHKLIDDIQIILRPNADVTFASIDDAKNVINSMKTAKEVAEKVKKALKARALERMKEM